MIVQAACRVYIPGVGTYGILPLYRHSDAGKIFKTFGFKLGECKIVEQGFLDNCGNFYNRKSAMQEAKRCKQPLIREEKEELFSENLY